MKCNEATDALESHTRPWRAKNANPRKDWDNLARRGPPTMKHSALSTVLGLLLLVDDAHAGDAFTIDSVSGPVTVAAKDGAVQEAHAGMSLADGSELTGGSKDASVQIECPNHATQTLSGEFDALIDMEDLKTDVPSTGGPKSACVVNLKVGTAVATSGNRTSEHGMAAIISGPVTMASNHTQFGFTASEDPTTAQGEGFVLDGDATLYEEHVTHGAFVISGTQVDADTKKMLAIDPDRFKALAALYTQLDLSQPSVTEIQDKATWRDRWAAVFHNPGDAKARIELVETQDKGHAVDSGIFKYEVLRAVAVATPETVDAELQRRARVIAQKYRLGLSSPNAPTGVSVR
jgi:hypothetical protein